MQAVDGVVFVVELSYIPSITRVYDVFGGVADVDGDSGHLREVSGLMGSIHIHGTPQPLLRGAVLVRATIT